MSGRRKSCFQKCTPVISVFQCLSTIAKKSIHSQDSQNKSISIFPFRVYISKFRSISVHMQTCEHTTLSVGFKPHHELQRQGRFYIVIAVDSIYSITVFTVFAVFIVFTVYSVYAVFAVFTVIQ